LTEIEEQFKAEQKKLIAKEQEHEGKLNDS
jgi:hypothetical protein